MINNYKYHIAAVAGVMMMLTSCFKEDLLPQDGGSGDFVTLDINISVPDMDQVATKAVDPDGGGVQNITLFCFDQYGLFVSTLSADVTPDGSGISLTGSFKAEVPEHVKTVHLVGNQNLSYFAEGIRLSRQYFRTCTSEMPHFFAASATAKYSMCHHPFCVFGPRLAIETFANRNFSYKNRTRNTIDTLENLDFFEPKKFEKPYYLEDLDNLETLDSSQLRMAFKRSAVRSRLSPPKALKTIGFQGFFA